MNQIIFWLVIGIAALVIDVITSSFFFAGLTVGSIAAIIAQMIGASFTVQFAAFAIVSIIAIAIEYEWLRKKLRKSIPKTLTQEEEYIGRKITLEDDVIDRGKAKLEGIYWTVENEGEPIKKGEKAEIIGIKGNKLIIKK